MTLLPHPLTTGIETAVINLNMQEGIYSMLFLTIDYWLSIILNKNRPEAKWKIGALW